MVREDETSALELRIEVNGQNLSAIPEKCSISTLRPPSDPSWPKIPLRRLTSSTDDIIKPPCVVTLTGTTRRSCNIVQTVTRPCPKTRINQKQETCTHIPKKLPGYNDPRFKRQISRQKTERPDVFCDARDNDRETKSDSSTRILREDKKKLENDSRKTGESQNDIRTCCDTDKSLENVGKQSLKQTIDRPTPEANGNHPARVAQRHADENALDERHSIGVLFQEQKQEANRPLLLMVDEKKLHALPINAVNVEAAASSSASQTSQCYSVQIPVVSYHNVPLQIPNIPVQMQNVQSICALTKSRTCVFKNSEHGEDVQKCNATSGLTQNRSSSNASNRELRGISLDRNRRGESDTVEKSGGDFSSSSIAGKSKIVGEDHEEERDGPRNDAAAPSHCRSRSTLLGDIVANLNQGKFNRDVDVVANDGKDSRVPRKESGSEKRVAKSRARPRRRRLVVRCSKGGRGNANERSANVTKNETWKKNIRDLVLGRIKDGECKEMSNENEKRGDLKRKVAPINLSRKIRSFLRRKSRLAITDSDCTLILPGPRCVRNKRHGKIRRSKMVNPFEKPSSIPLETQELLNRSYWEYYSKLRRKTVSPNGAEKKSGCADESRERLPESQTLQRCSVLSCMINNTLDTAFRDSAAIDGKVWVPAGNATSNVRENVTASSSAQRIKRKKTKCEGTQLLEIKTIALLVSTLCLAVVLLPMMYEHLFEEEHDDYENASYIGLTLEYVASSFTEAFGGIVDFLNMVFLRPVRHRKL